MELRDEIDKVMNDTKDIYFSYFSNVAYDRLLDRLEDFIKKKIEGGIMKR